MTAEETLINRYFDAFNRHDIEAVMECFHPNAVIIDPSGKRVEGHADVRRHYQVGFASVPDGNCELRMCTGNAGRAVAESRFTGTRASSGKTIEAMGAELMEIAEGKIKEIRDYHQSSASKAA
jgi:taurine dehydrogenase small subunit